MYSLDVEFEKKKKNRNKIAKNRWRFQNPNRIHCAFETQLVNFLLRKIALLKMTLTDPVISKSQRMESDAFRSQNAKNFWYQPKKSKKGQWSTTETIAKKLVFVPGTRFQVPCTFKSRSTDKLEVRGQTAI